MGRHGGGIRLFICSFLQHLTSSDVVLEALALSLRADITLKLIHSSYNNKLIIIYM